MFDALWLNSGQFSWVSAEEVSKLEDPSKEQFISTDKEDIEKYLDKEGLPLTEEEVWSLFAVYFKKGCQKSYRKQDGFFNVRSCFARYHNVKEYREMYPDKTRRDKIIKHLIHYGNSEWHEKWVNALGQFCTFTERRLVDNETGKYMLPDALCKSTKTVFEVQHSYIGESYEERNIFYKKQGYKVVWIIDGTFVNLIPVTSKNKLRIVEKNDISPLFRLLTFNIEKGDIVYVQLKNKEVYRIYDAVQDRDEDGIGNAIWSFIPLEHYNNQDDFIEAVKDRTDYWDTVKAYYQKQIDEIVGRIKYIKSNIQDAFIKVNNEVDMMAERARKESETLSRKFWDKIDHYIYTTRADVDNILIDFSEADKIVEEAEKIRQQKRKEYNLYKDRIQSGLDWINNKINTIACDNNGKREQLFQTIKDIKGQLLLAIDKITDEQYSSMLNVENKIDAKIKRKQKKEEQLREIEKIKENEKAIRDRLYQDRTQDIDSCSIIFEKGGNFLIINKNNYLIKLLGDKAENKELCKRNLIWLCLSSKIKTLSFNGAYGYYRNELCFDTTNGETFASADLSKMSLDLESKNILMLWKNVLEEAKKTANYNSEMTYGIYQIMDELNTFHKDIPDYPILNDYLRKLSSAVDLYKKNTDALLKEVEEKEI